MGLNGARADYWESATIASTSVITTIMSDSLSVPAGAPTRRGLGQFLDKQGDEGKQNVEN